MANRKNSRKDTVQNILIVLLSLSALLLLAQTWQPFVTGGSSRSPAASASLQTEPAALAAPVRFAAAGAYGRYGDTDMTTADEDFAPPVSLLREALGSAGAAAACSGSDFRQALMSDCAYYDFEITLPLSVLAELVGAEIPSALEAMEARRMLLSTETSGVALYLTDDASFWRCSTQAAADALSALIDSYPTGNALFAFELEQETLDPYTLLMVQQPAYPLLTVSDPLEDQDLLLSRLKFNPRTNFRYAESSGTQVVQEGDRKIRIASDGTVSYDSGGSSELAVSAAGDVLTAREAALGAFRLLDQLFPEGSSLCLREITREGEAWLVSFDYQFSGMWVRRSSGLPAAEVRLTGAVVEEFTLWPRQYAAGDGESLLLPMTQALAIASPLEGRELVIRYTDSGGSELSAGWLAE